jgi:cytochrome b
MVDSKTARAAATTAHPALVWDWPLRVFHWALAACVAGSFATHYAGLEWFDWHRRLGYATLVLVLFRVIWGFVGTRYARFANFVRGPREVAQYLRGDLRVSAGHNPLGALSVLAFLCVLLLQATTGLFANDEIANAGPFYGWVSQATSNSLTALHELNSSVLVGLVVLHLLAVAWYDLGRRRAGLVRAMVTGRKPGPAQGIHSSRALLALAIVATLAVALALAIRAAPEASVGFYF